MEEAGVFRDGRCGMNEISQPVLICSETWLLVRFIFPPPDNVFEFRPRGRSLLKINHINADDLSITILCRLKPNHQFRQTIRYKPPASVSPLPSPHGSTGHLIARQNRVVDVQADPRLTPGVNPGERPLARWGRAPASANLHLRAADIMLRGHAVQRNMLDPHQVLAGRQRSGKGERKGVFVLGVPHRAVAVEAGRDFVDFGPLPGAVVGGGGGGGLGDVDDERAGVVD